MQDPAKKQEKNLTLLLPFVITRNKMLYLSLAQQQVVPGCAALRRSCLVPSSEVPLVAAPVENSALEKDAFPSVPEPGDVRSFSANLLTLSYHPPRSNGDVLLTPSLPCVLAIASSEYLQSIRCLLKYSLWIKAQYFLASLRFLSCLLLTVIYLPFSPRLLIGLNSFCLLVGLPFPYNPPKRFGLSHTFPVSSRPTRSWDERNQQAISLSWH